MMRPPSLLIGEFHSPVIEEVEEREEEYHQRRQCEGNERHSLFQSLSLHVSSMSASPTAAHGLLHHNHPHHDQHYQHGHGDAAAECGNPLSISPPPPDVGRGAVKEEEVTCNQRCGEDECSSSEHHPCQYYDECNNHPLQYDAGECSSNNNNNNNNKRTVSSADHHFHLMVNRWLSPPPPPTPSIPSPQQRRLSPTSPARFAGGSIASDTSKTPDTAAQLLLISAVAAAVTTSSTAFGTLSPSSSPPANKMVGVTDQQAKLPCPPLASSSSSSPSAFSSPRLSSASALYPPPHHQQQQPQLHHHSSVIPSPLSYQHHHRPMFPEDTISSTPAAVTFLYHNDDRNASLPHFMPYANNHAISSHNGKCDHHHNPVRIIPRPPPHIPPLPVDGDDPCSVGGVPTQPSSATPINTMMMPSSANNAAAGSDATITAVTAASDGTITAVQLPLLCSDTECGQNHNFSSPSSSPLSSSSDNITMALATRQQLQPASSPQNVHHVQQDSSSFYDENNQERDEEHDGEDCHDPIQDGCDTPLNPSSFDLYYVDGDDDVAEKEEPTQGGGRSGATASAGAVCDGGGTQWKKSSNKNIKSEEVNNNTCPRDGASLNQKTLGIAIKSSSPSHVPSSVISVHRDLSRTPGSSGAVASSSSRVSPASSCASASSAYSECSSASPVIALVTAALAEHRRCHRHREQEQEHHHHQVHLATVSSSPSLDAAARNPSINMTTGSPSSIAGPTTTTAAATSPMVNHHHHCTYVPSTPLLSRCIGESVGDSGGKSGGPLCLAPSTRATSIHGHGNNASTISQSAPSSATPSAGNGAPPSSSVSAVSFGSGAGRRDASVVATTAFHSGPIVVRTDLPSSLISSHQLKKEEQRRRERRDKGGEEHQPVLNNHSPPPTLHPLFLFDRRIPHHQQLGVNAVGSARGIGVVAWKKDEGKAEKDEAPAHHHQQKQTYNYDAGPSYQGEENHRHRHNHHDHDNEVSSAHQHRHHQHHQHLHGSLGASDSHRNRHHSSTSHQNTRRRRFIDIPTDDELRAFLKKSLGSAYPYPSSTTSNSSSSHPSSPASSTNLRGGVLGSGGGVHGSFRGACCFPSHRRGDLKELEVVPSPATSPTTAPAPLPPQ